MSVRREFHHGKWIEVETVEDSPAVLRKNRGERFVQVPWAWVEKLAGARGKTHQLALYLLFLHWKGNGKPIKLANSLLRIDGISRQSKWRTLAELERLGLITVERRPKRSPIIRLNLSHP